MPPLPSSCPTPSFRTCQVAFHHGEVCHVPVTAAETPSSADWHFADVSDSDDRHFSGPQRGHGEGDTAGECSVPAERVCVCACVCAYDSSLKKA